MTRFKFSKRRGAALAFVIVAFLVVTIYSVFIAYLVSTNLNQAKTQERNMQAYYLAMSGVDLCISALIQEGSDGEDDTLMHDLFDPSITNPPTLTDDLELEDGTVNLTVSAITRNSERWIEIVAIATLDISGATERTVLQFKYSEPRIQMQSD